MFGRRRIYCDAEKIDASNIVGIITEALTVHEKNRVEIELLRRRLAGNQPILSRVKKTREDINNKVVVNIDAQIMNFKESYIFSQPVNITKTANTETDIDITPFIRMMDEQDKDRVDHEIAHDMLLCGLGYRGALANPDESETAPFCMFSMRPETTFVVRKNDIFKRIMLGVSYIERTDGTIRLTAYTDTTRFELSSKNKRGGLSLVDESANGIGRVPIICYEMPELMGVFEKVIPLCDAYNTVTSNRIDDIEQFIQSILAIFGVDLKDDDLDRLKRSLCLIVPNIQDGVNVQAKYLTNSLDQTSVQAIADDLYSHILSIAACPARAQASGGNTASAIEQGAGGWRECQFAADRIIAAWKTADREMYRLVLEIMARNKRTPQELRGLKATDLETKISVSRNNDLLVKTQSLTTMIQIGVAPRVAFETINLFPDPAAVYEESVPYIERALKRMEGGDEDPAAGDNSKADANRRGDVTNQPKSPEKLENAATQRGIAQKN